MRSPLRQFTKYVTGISLVLTASTLLLIFQNCGGMAAQYNPLYDSDSSVACIGVACYEDLSQASLTSSAQGILLDAKSAGATAATCDSSTCFDVGGFCDTGGFPGSVIYYQWLLSGQGASPEVKTAVNCDANGRWRVLVQVPFATFDWSSGTTHRLRVFMHIIDDNGIEALNPNGTSEISYAVSTRP